ncbi:MAG: hypothetical protein HWE39_16675 [Oceanospirillaceae bacterium]|nr:hypothetical protein [Oceanospirillaceae bacterium]
MPGHSIAAAIGPQAKKSGAGARLLAELRRRGLLPVGERSCKLREGQLLTERFLLGIPAGELPREAFFELAREFGLGAAGQARLRQCLDGASEIQFAFEQEGDRTLCKLYLEYWDALVQRVRDGNIGPELLNLGLKWPEAEPEKLVEDRYVCMPKLPHLDILERLRGRQGALGEIVAELVIWACAAVPDRSLVYLEVDDAAGGRRSYDLNLYPCRRRLADAAPRLLAISDRLGCEREVLCDLLGRYGDAPLGHISGGSDRQGRSFFTFYYEVGAL